MINDELDRLEALAGERVYDCDHAAAYIEEVRPELLRLVAEVRRLTKERDEAMAIASKWETVGPL